MIDRMSVTPNYSRKSHSGYDFYCDVPPSQTFHGVRSPFKKVRWRGEGGDLFRDKDEDPGFPNGNLDIGEISIFPPLSPFLPTYLPTHKPRRRSCGLLTPPQRNKLDLPLPTSTSAHLSIPEM